MRQAPIFVEDTAPPAEGLGLVGSWSVTVFETEGPPTRGLFTLGADGTLVAAEHPVVTPPDAPTVIFTSSGHGAWKTTGPNEALFTCIGLGSDGSGNLFAVVTFSGSLAVGADRHMLTGQMTATIEDPSGTTMATFPMTLRGRRIVPEPSRPPSLGAPITAAGA